MTKCKHEFTGIPYLSRCGMECNICSIFREFGSVEISEKDVDEICKEKERMDNWPTTRIVSKTVHKIAEILNPPTAIPKSDLLEWIEKNEKKMLEVYEHKGVWSYLLKKFIEGYGETMTDVCKFKKGDIQISICGKCGRILGAYQDVAKMESPVDLSFICTECFKMDLRFDGD